MKDRLFILLIGIPGSGKSTLAETLASEKELFRSKLLQKCITNAAAHPGGRMG